jgi:hypothetical protein
VAVQGASEDALRLRRLWDAQRRRPFPGPADDPALDEIALYQAWLGPIAEGALARGGRLAPGHDQMLAARRAEASSGIWAAAGGLSGQAKEYVARLLAIEELLASLPTDD